MFVPLCLVLLLQLYACTRACRMRRKRRSWRRAQQRGAVLAPVAVADKQDDAELLRRQLAEEKQLVKELVAKVDAQKAEFDKHKEVELLRRQLAEGKQIVKELVAKLDAQKAEIDKQNEELEKQKAEVPPTRKDMLESITKADLWPSRPMACPTYSPPDVWPA